MNNPITTSSSLPHPLPRFRGQVLRQVYRVWLVRRFLPVFVLEVGILAIVLYELGRVTFVRRVLENALNVFFLNPSAIFYFVSGAFFHAPLATKIMGAGFLVLSALIVRHLTQGLLRFILVRVNYFSRLQK